MGLRIVSSALALLLSSAVTAQASDGIDGFIQHLKEPHALTEQEISNKVNRRMRVLQKGSTLAHSRLTTYYKRVLGACASEFPSGTLETVPERTLRKYSGTLKLEEPETFGIPCMLISPRASSAKNLKFFKLETRYQNRTIYGLRVEAHVRSPYRYMPMHDLVQSYIPDVNARAAGFTHGRVMLELSENLDVADFFSYNGKRQWSEHERYAARDQVEKQIELTNWAHAASGRYVISSHPDFSLVFQNYKREPALITTFLWRDAAQDRLPDFVFQLVLSPIDMR